MSEVSAVLSQAPATAPARPRRWWLVAAAVVAAGAAGAFLPGLFRRQAPPSTARPVPLTAYAGNEIYSSFSPDGTQVAFSWSGERQDNADIYIKTLESPAPLRLTTDPAMDFSPAWAPDGRSIAFLRSAGQANASIMLIPATGGPARKLADITLATDISVFRDANSAVSASAVVSDLPASSLSWSPDSQWLAFGVKESRETPATLQLISVSSGERRKLTNPAHTLAGDSDPAFAPGGRAIAFARNASLGYGDIYVLPLDAQLRPRGEPARITNDNKRMAGMAWMGPNEILYSAGDSLHEFRLWRVAVDASAKPQLWSAVLTDSCYPSISADGRKLAFTTRSLDSNIWEVERLAGGKTRARRLVASTRIDFNGRYSPDGKRIAFASNRSGEMEMWVANTEDGAQRQITELRGGNAGSPRWSPDANWLVFDWLKQGIWGVYKVSVNGGQPVLMTSRPGGDNNPVFSADGRWVYFASERSGNSQVWKVPSQGGEPVMVTHGGGQASAESPDGAWLYFARSYDLATQLWRMPSSGGEETQVLPSIFRRAFAISNDGIYFIPAPGGDGITSIRFHPFKGPEVEIHEIQSPVSWGLSLSPDARKLLYTQYDQTGSDLVLVEGFR
jgi:Tol biopolymer transport system component